MRFPFIEVTVGPNLASFITLEQTYGTLSGKPARFTGQTHSGEVAFNATIIGGGWTAPESGTLAVDVVTDINGAEEGRLLFDATIQKGLYFPY